MRESNPNAKINIGLNITSRRADGFHDIETVFYPVRLADHLTIVPASGSQTDSLTTTAHTRTVGGAIDTSISDELSKCAPGGNIVEKALALLRESHDIPPMSITLDKRIPIGAGLGGGSADAAFLIKQINTELSLGLTTAQMRDMAARLGSDCAFFIDNTPKYATGRGEVMQPAPNVLDGYTVKIIKPMFNISTKEAYSKVKPQQPKTPLLEDIKRPISEWRHYIKNDFEQFLFPEYPALQRYKDALYDSGALYASMTGSGSALYGIYEGEPVLDGEIKDLAV